MKDPPTPRSLCLFQDSRPEGMPRLCPSSPPTPPHPFLPWCSVSPPLGWVGRNWLWLCKFCCCHIIQTRVAKTKFTELVFLFSGYTIKPLVCALSLYRSVGLFLLWGWIDIRGGSRDTESSLFVVVWTLAASFHFWYKTNQCSVTSVGQFQRSVSRPWIIYVENKLPRWCPGIVSASLSSLFVLLLFLVSLVLFALFLLGRPDMNKGWD